MKRLTTLAILHVEDEPNDVVLLKHALSAAGVPNPVQHVEDGEMAVQYISGSGAFADRAAYPLPCLAIIDVKMPRRGGLELLQWIRTESHLRSLVVIMFSSSFMERDIEDAYARGANSFVVKPSSLAEHVEFAKALNSYWLKLNRVAPALLQRAALRE